MRRSVLILLRCPKCQLGRLVPDSDASDIHFGPVRCDTCHSSFPVAEGVVDLVTDATADSPVQRGHQHPMVARTYERYLRPALQIVSTRKRLDADSEYLLYRSLLGQPKGPVLDLGCGTGLLARRLSRDANLPQVIGLDVSKAMLEEAVAQAREANVRVDFLRAAAPSLPFQNGTLGAVLFAASLLHFDDLHLLFGEVARVLMPGGVVVAGLAPPRSRTAGLVYRQAGLHPHSEQALADAARASGLTRWERVQLKPFLLVRGEKPGAAD